MKKRLYLFMFMLTALFYSLSASAVSIQNTKGWFESGYVTWAREAGATYTVYYRPAGGTYVQMDKELVRLYNDYGRADMVGLKAGNYQFKVVSSISGEAESDVFYAAPHDRSGFAHIGMTEGIGAYKNDGTLKDNARVIYVTAKTAKTVKCYVMGDKDVEYTGLQAIIAAYEKGKETRPLCVRIIGTIKAADMDSFGSNEGLQVKGKSGSTNMNITIEGIGSDAAVHGFGFLARSAKSVEFRNFGILLFKDDGISVDTDNHNVWIHNMDFFYGSAGSDSDQAKGDGTVDIKGKSSHNTISYNHFYDSGKCSLGGMKSETTDCWMTFHHNWFDHSDSRHPRIRTAFYHVYNNYFDGNSKYGVGVTSGGSSFVESNYFRNCKYPVLISKQGTDAEGDGTFSGEDGGVNKIFNNIFINPRKVQIYDGEQTDGKWDAVEVDNRSDEVTVKCLTGGTGYNNAADAAARTTYVENNMDDPEDIPAIVRGEFITREGLGAGRIDGGDFKWTFDNSQQDENYGVISDLKTAVVSYEGTVQSFGDGSAISDRTPATTTVDGGDGKGLDQEVNDSYTPSWAGGSGDTPTPEDPEEEEATAKVIYDWASKVGTSRYVSETITGKVNETTVKIKGTSTNCVSFGKTLSTGDTLKVKPDFCMVIKPAEGTFLKGDTIHITGCYNNKSTKTATVVFYYGTQKLFGTEQFANTYDGETVPTEQLLVLEQDCDSICLGREGNTSTCVTALTVVRPASATIKGDVNNDGSVTMADANMVVNYFLAEDKDSISGFNKEAGDVNKDGDISMADANAIVNIFLSGNTQ